MSRTLTIGKLCGLRRMADERGIFTMAAEDQRPSLRKMLNPTDPAAVPTALLTEIKLDIARALSPHASALLIDPEYGAAQCLAAGALRGAGGLLVTLEDSDYAMDGDDYRAAVLPGWGVEKIKRMGAAGVKFLVQFRPDRGRATAHQRDIVARLGEECQEHDIPFILEPIGYGADGIAVDSPEYAARKPEIVVESARLLSPLGVDVYKAEFPANPAHERDEAALRGHCEALDDACAVPWVLLSAGVDIDAFRAQVRVACQAGASGFLAGRTIWQQAVRLPAGERRRFLETTGVERLRGLTDIAREYGQPWDARATRGFESEPIDETWYRAY